jgi:hypothetical protein
MICICYGRTAFLGNILISREFYNPRTNDYLLIEAHEMEQEGQFEVAFWVNAGNNGDGGCSGSLRHVVKSIQEYVPDAGMIEMTIPNEAFM